MHHLNIHGHVPRTPMRTRARAHTHTHSHTHTHTHTRARAERDRRTDRQTDRTGQRDRGTEGQRDRGTEGQRDRGTEGQTERPTDRPRQTDGQIDRHTDRQTDRRNTTPPNAEPVQCNTEPATSTALGGSGRGRSKPGGNCCRLAGVHRLGRVDRQHKSRRPAARAAAARLVRPASQARSQREESRE